MIWFHQQGQAIRLAFSRLVGAPVGTLLSLIVIGIAAALPAGGGWLLFNIAQMAPLAQASPQISVFMKASADRKSTQEVEAWAAQQTGVAAVRLVPREETADRLRSTENLGDILDALPSNPFPDALTLTTTDDQPEHMEMLAAELRKHPKVDHVELDATWARRLNALLDIGRTGLALLSLLLGIGLIAITFNTIRLQLLSHQAEIELCRLLGATDAFIRRPFVWFGLLQGGLGGIFAWLIVGATGLWLSGPLDELAKLYQLNVTVGPMGGIESGLLVGMTALLGWMGATLSIRQYLGNP